MELTSIDVINLILISLLSVFFLIQVRLDKLFDKPKIYLKIGLITVIILLIIDQIISLNKTELVLNLLPISYLLYFSIYPLFYVYSRDMVFNGHDLKRPPIIYFLIFPILIFVLICALYYPLSLQNKLAFFKFHLSQTNHNSSVYSNFQMIVIPAYYFQTIFYIFLTILLVREVKKQVLDNILELRLVRNLLLYVAGVIFYEALEAWAVIYLFNEPFEKRLIEMIITFIFISFGMYVAFNQSLVLIQARFAKLSSKAEKGKIAGINYIYSDMDKMEIKNAIENYLTESKIYLKSTLTIESFSRRIHIQSRKISLVINDLLGKNFHQFINEYRISEAIKLMDGEKNIIIENLYDKVGFNSRSTFNRVFKEITGLSPSEFLSKKKSA